MTKNQVKLLVDTYARTYKKERAIAELLDTDGDCLFQQDIRSHLEEILRENVPEELQYKLGCALSDGDADMAWVIVSGMYREQKPKLYEMEIGQECITVKPETEEKIYKAEFAGEALIRAKTKQQAEFNLLNNLMIENKYIEINMCYEQETETE